MKVAVVRPCCLGLLVITGSRYQGSFAPLELLSLCLISVSFRLFSCALLLFGTELSLDCSGIRGFLDNGEAFGTWLDYGD